MLDDGWSLSLIGNGSVRDIRECDNLPMIVFLIGVFGFGVVTVVGFGTVGLGIGCDVGVGGIGGC